jgi:hypothetical protein
MGRNPPVSPSIRHMTGTRVPEPSRHVGFGPDPLASRAIPEPH